MRDEASVASGKHKGVEDDVTESCLILTKAQGIPPQKLSMLNPRLNMGNLPMSDLVQRIMVSFNGGLNAWKMLIIRQVQKKI